VKVNDAISGAIFLVLAILTFVHAGTFPAMRGVAYGPDLFPRLIAVLMGLGGVILIVSGLRSTARQPWLQLSDWARQPRSYILFAAVVGGVVFYLLAADVLGFMLAAFLMLTTVLAVTRGTTRLGSSAGIAAVVTVLIYMLFAQTLRVPLPHGVLERLLVA
tara:strand:- start:9833 stop:10315 length:483 start_codon:yes stop_codon:yes gene_type:complete